MRVALVVHGFPPVERTGVENYAAALAEALARAGHGVVVFVPRRDPARSHGSVRRESRGAFEVHWIADNVPPTGVRDELDRPALAREFGRFLERERPDVVHFQHFVKLGVGLVFEARQRGIPTVYTAHDYFPVCHRYTLLRPDLAHCDIRGDSMACARCDLAAGFLNARSERLGDYQMGALAEQLEPDEARALQAILDGRPEDAGSSEAEQDAACDLRRELDSLRARAFVALDRILAPTGFLARELVRGGVDKRKVHLQPYGIALAGLCDVPAIRPDPRAPVRLGYLGGFSKQKGVHVLLAAFERMRARAELVLHGGGTDRAYVELLRREARRVGARLGGPYERADLPRLLAEIDLVVVPSIWVENYPIVIREALAARRPVVTSRFGALPESVRHGIDGLLVPPGDAEALARALDEACAPGVLEALAADAPEVKSIEREAEELVAHYRAVERAPAPAARPLPATLASFVADVERLERLPTSELLARALAGVKRLRAALLPGSAPAEDLLHTALAGGTRAQALVRDLRREHDWGEQQARALLTALGLAREPARAGEPALESLRAGVRRLEAELRDEVRGLFAITAEDAGAARPPSPRSPLVELVAALGERRATFGAEHGELLWRRRLAADLEAEIAGRRAQIDGLEAELASLRAEVAWRKEQGEAVGRELEWRRTTMGELEAELARLREQSSRAQQELGQRTSELEWRRREMEEVRVRTRRGLLRLLGPTAFARRVRAWPRDGGAPS